MEPCGPAAAAATTTPPPQTDARALLKTGAGFLFLFLVTCWKGVFAPSVTAPLYVMALELEVLAFRQESLLIGGGGLAADPDVVVVGLDSVVRVGDIDWVEWGPSVVANGGDLSGEVLD